MAISKKLIISNVLIIKYHGLEIAQFNPIFGSHSNNFDIRNITIDELGNAEATVEVKIKKHENKLLTDLKSLKGVRKVMMFLHTGELSE